MFENAYSRPFWKGFFLDWSP